MKEALNMEEGAGIRTAVDIFVTNNRHQILMGLRSSAVGNNYWGFPGGHQQTGETIAETAKREIEEEVGTRAQIEITNTVVAVRENRLPPFFIPHLTVIILGNYIGGELQLPEGEKNKEWRWFDIDSELPPNVFSKADEVIRNYRKGVVNVITDFHSP